MSFVPKVGDRVEVRGAHSSTYYVVRAIKQLKGKPYCDVLLSYEDDPGRGRHWVHSDSLYDPPRYRAGCSQI